MTPTELSMRPARAPAPRRVLLYGLAVLWLLDGLLQLQPGMFTMDMISTIMQPAANGEPGWLTALINWSINLVTPHLVLFNWSVVILQLLIGVLLFMPRKGLVEIGLWLSFVWGLIVWVFGEGLGQLLTGSATFLTGAPGSVLLYVVATILLLLPEERMSWWRNRRVDTATWAVALTLMAGAVLQLSPVFWTSLGLAVPFGSGAMMPQPLWIRWSLSTAATMVGNAPVLSNVGIIAVSLGLGILLLLKPYRRWIFVAALTWLALVWWFGQDLGMLFGGMATDPNTAPILALSLWAGWTTRDFRHSSVAQTADIAPSTGRPRRDKVADHRAPMAVQDTEAPTES